MIDYKDVFIYSDQPTTCPKCQWRSEIIMDMAHTNKGTEIHLCINPACHFEFIMQQDSDFEDGSLL